MKTATVEQRPAGSDAMVNSSISICVGSWCCWWLRVGEAAYKGFFVKGGSVMVHRRWCGGGGGAQRCMTVQLHRRRVRTTEKRFGGLKRWASPLSRIFLKEAAVA
jgi:hypothetical protein